MSTASTDSDAARATGTGGSRADGGEVSPSTAVKALPRVVGIPFHIWNLGWVSLCFLLLFMAYNTIQNYVTSLLPGHLGNTSLTVLYVAVAVTVFSAPVIVDRVGAKWVMVLGAACYVCYLGSLGHVIDGVVLCASAVTGFGAALLWVGFGVYIAQLGKLGFGEGTAVGIFWSIFQLSNVLGNLGAYFVFEDVSGSAWFFIVFAILAAVATVLLVFLGRIPKEFDLREHQGRGKAQRADRDGPPEAAAMYSAVAPADGSAPDAGQEHVRVPTVAQSLRTTFAMLGDGRILLMTPMFFWTGFELAGWTGTFPELLQHKVIGLVMTFSGVGEVLGGAFLGRLSDRCGWASATVLGFAVYAGALVLTAVLRSHKVHGTGPTVATVGGAPLLAYAAALCYGLGDSAFNTVTYGLLSDILPDAHSFTLFQLAQNIGSAVGFYYATAVPLTGDGGSLVQVYVQASVMVVATAGVLATVRGYARGTASERRRARREEEHALLGEA